MTELDKLGARHKKLLADLEDLKPQLHAAMREDRAKVDENGKRLFSQNDIREKSGYKTIQQVRVILGEAKAASDD